jgi:hydroxymethylpyrimidine/phosphomethylpyrimidine kinase
MAGHDPSGGAGITSDIKTFEAHGLYGVSVCTAITVQNDRNFKQCTWIPRDTIIAQIEILFERYQIDTVKVGLVQSWAILVVILEKLHALNPKIKVVLDPILKATAGFDFHLNEEQDILGAIWKYCYIIVYIPKKILKKLWNTSAVLRTSILKGGIERTKKDGMNCTIVAL